MFVIVTTKALNWSWVGLDFLTIYSLFINHSAASWNPKMNSFTGLKNKNLPSLLVSISVL
jgi:hypothetical protein